MRVDNDDMKFDISHNMKFSKNVQLCHKIEVLDGLKKLVFHVSSPSKILNMALEEFMLGVCQKKIKNYKVMFIHEILVERRIHKNRKKNKKKSSSKFMSSAKVQVINTIGESSGKFMVKYVLSLGYLELKGEHGGLF